MTLSFVRSSSVTGLMLTLFAIVSRVPHNEVPLPCSANCSCLHYAFAVHFNPHLSFTPLNTAPDHTLIPSSLHPESGHFPGPDSQIRPIMVPFGCR